MKLLKTTPEKGTVGTSFTISGEGLPPGKTVDLQWQAWEGTYVTKVSPDNVEYVERTYAKKRTSLGSVASDAQGKASATFSVPEDHGEIHEIYGVVDGTDIAKGAYRILRSVTVSSTKGPVGEPIVITVKGMAPSYYQSTMAVRWDNRYTGFISTVTTKGTGIAKIRAAGPVGDHVLQVYPASHAVPYLNSHEGPNWHILGVYPDTFVYTVTKDNGAPEAATEWPEDSRVANVSIDAPRTTANSTSAVPAVLQPASGTILSKVTLRADSLPLNTDVQLFWVTARGNRASSSGWSLDSIALGKAKTGANGSLQTTFEVPDDLGGWHTVRVYAGDKLLSDAPYYVERNLLQAPPKRVKAGELITIQMKGIGWTELDNGVAVTYDNGYVGMACGFNSNGNITLYLNATGGPGTHLIDIYPMIYEGHPNKQAFNFAVPQLTALEDQPGLALGYRLPIFRVAIEVVP
ncbi:MAG: hypothetical protein HYX79_06345 [Chloroflexi bacterium]|nr:hypothetical protein [Chloroflexota bacterium]